MKKIEVSPYSNSSVISYVAYGTIGYLKMDKEIRQCKCVGAKWIDGHPRYEWKVAGIKEHQFGSACILECGIIYKTEVGAQRGKDEMTDNREVSVQEYMMRKYGLGRECFRRTSISSLTIVTYTLLTNHTIEKWTTEFEIEVTKDGIDMTIPFLEGAVNGMAKRYATAEEAYKAQQPLKVYSLDDEDDEGASVARKIKITIEIDESDVEQIKQFAVIL